MRARPPRSPTRPHFFWQGALIVLPALVLAGAGFYSLRQDDVLAQHEATEQARRIATELAEHVIPQALHFDLPDAGSVPRPASLPDDELLQRLRRSPLAASGWLIDPDGVLLYPPRPAPLPVPQPVDLGELPPNQQDGWLALEAMWSGETPVDERELNAFVEAGASERYAALARFRTAGVCARAGQVGQACALLQLLGRLAPEVVSESGVPLRWLAGFQLATLVTGEERVEILNRLCSGLLADPSPVTDVLFERIAALGPPGRRWDEVRAAHQEARDLHAILAADPNTTSVSLHGEEHWPLEQAVDGGRWMVAVPVGELAATVRRLERSMVKPAPFGVAVSVGPHPLLDRPPARPALAQAASDSFPAQVSVFLTDPAAFAAQRRVRTARVGALIALSAGAVLAGFFTAWRAFRRQHQLSEMKSNFVSSVSHELRAPIASVRLMAEELERGGTPGPEKLRQYHRFIGQECRRLSAVIENVLDFSRREQGREQFDSEATDLAALVEETVALMQTYGAERSVRIESTLLGAAQPVEADGRALQRLLVNLIDNALKHAPDGSAVTVGLEFAAGRVSLWVEDGGPGIPRAEHERIFERFYRVGSELRRQTQGVGLGLSIVKHLAEVHGGRVLVRSEPGRGSRFTVELPLRPAGRPQAAEVGAGAGRDEPGRERSGDGCGQPQSSPDETGHDGAGQAGGGAEPRRPQATTSPIGHAGQAGGAVLPGL